MIDTWRQFQIATVLIVTSLFVALWVLESRINLRQLKRSRPERLLVNAVLSALALGTGAAVIVPLVRQLMAWADKNGFGLLNLIPLWEPVELLVGMLLMDLTFYYWHRVNHAVPLLWRFHNVHHVDPDLDVSTSFRFHFGEVLYSSGFRVLQILLLGLSPLNYVLYELAFQCATVFHHSNLRLPIEIERRLNWIIVTPRMHGVHHSTIKEETNSNFSVVFRWWDWFHRTLRLNVPQGEVIIGVPAYLRAEDNQILNLLMMPLIKQREHWNVPDVPLPQRGSVDWAKTVMLA